MKQSRLHILQPGLFDVSHETFWGATPLCVLLNFEALLQLSAGGVNIVTTGVTNRGLDATGLKTTLKILNLMNRRRLERAALDVVKLNQVNVAQRCLRSWHTHRSGGGQSSRCKAEAPREVEAACTS